MYYFQNTVSKITMSFKVSSQDFSIIFIYLFPNKMPARPTKQFQNSEIPNYKNYNPIKGKIFNQSLVGLDLQTILYSLEQLSCSCLNFQTIFPKTDYWRLFPYFKPILSYKKLICLLYNIFQRRHYKFQPIRSDNSVIKKTIS